MTHPTFTNLWPTQFMEIMLPGHDQANPILIDHIETLDRQKAQMTTDYRSENLFDEQHPVVQWLKQSVQRAVPPCCLAFDFLLGGALASCVWPHGGSLHGAP